LLLLRQKSKGGRHKSDGASLLSVAARQMGLRSHRFLYHSKVPSAKGRPDSWRLVPGALAADHPRLWR
jgi:hypothetical protein